ncbi:MAG: electron transfer flavoprotein-ubiquinone oxidoreductase [Legionellales bacterium]|nr:electron transfer flavoprotein-ubiquinone oxidoreductase [Legionellales bacterium]
MQRERLEVDVVIVGAGPAGLSAAIRLKQLATQAGTDLNICIVEKGAEVGAHILSGAVIEPHALNELIPDWQEKKAPVTTLATADYFYFLTEKHKFRLPTPPQMHNKGNYIVSLSNFCRWLGEQATEAGINIFPGFAATELLFDSNQGVIGIATGDMGRDKSGQPDNQFQPGIEIHAKQVILAEGCRGSLTKQLDKKRGITQNCQPQTYGIGIKELWQIAPEHHQTGTVIHSVGWPMDRKTYGGSFLYHMDNHQLAVGFVVGLDYENPYLNPFAELQRLKTHPSFRPLFESGQRIGYGARALNEGGYQSIPELSVPGLLIIGDSAGFLNVPKIKGTHLAMKSGIVAAESLFSAIQTNQLELPINYRAALEKTWLMPELYRARNIRPAFRSGLFMGLAYAAIDTYLLRGRAPWTLKNHADYSCLKPAASCTPIVYPKPDGKITFDKLSSVFLSNTFHEENQPCHLKLANPELAISSNFAVYDSPEQRYCPAGVYEIVQTDNGQPKLQINAQNCIHCKTCDTKDPNQNITWVPPEGGGGPNYNGM